MNDTTSSEIWYYASDGTSFGPFTRAELLRKAEEGVVKPETLVVRQGEEDWKAFSSIAPAPAATRKTKLSLTNREQGLVFGCLAPLIILPVLLFLVSLMMGGKKEEADELASGAIPSQQFRTFEFTSESFRAAFERQVNVMNLGSRFVIQSWEIADGNRNDYVQVTFDNGRVAMMLVLDPQTHKIRDISILSKTGVGDAAVQAATDFMILPMVVTAIVIQDDWAGKRQEIVTQAIMEAVRNRGDSTIKSTSNIRVKASVLQTMGQLMFYIEPT